MLHLRDETEFQPLPTPETFMGNFNSPLSRLRALAKAEARHPVTQSTVYCYIVATTDLDAESRMRQCGSGPNFQGGLISLSTCKHKMRAAREVDEWPGAWIVGLSSKGLHEGRQWLFFLTQIERAYGSHAELWDALSPDVREAKSAQKHVHGDVYRPLRAAKAAPHMPESYHPPREGHRHEQPKQWHKDIGHRSWNRPAALLVGDPQKSFLWTEPMLCYKGEMTRGYTKWSNLVEFLSRIEAAR